MSDPYNPPGLSAPGPFGVSGQPTPTLPPGPYSLPGQPYPPGPPPVPAPPPRPHDPFALALGNATLLGIGYLMARRWGAAIAAIITTAVLLTLIAAFGQPGWIWRGVLALWWIFTTIHGWRLTRAARVRSGRERAVAISAAVVVLLLVGAAAFDLRRIESAAHTAHEAGNCDESNQTLTRIAVWHQIVDPFVARRTADDTQACTLLLNALAEDDPAPLCGGNAPA